jgi:hypothetical protein
MSSLLPPEEAPWVLFDTKEALLAFTLSVFFFRKEEEEEGAEEGAEEGLDLGREPGIWFGTTPWFSAEGVPRGGMNCCRICLGKSASFLQQYSGFPAYSE